MDEIGGSFCDGCCKVFRTGKPQPLIPVVASRRALEDEASAVHVEGVVVDPVTGNATEIKKITTSMLYQVPSAAGQYHLRRPTATAVVNLIPPRLCNVPWGCRQTAYKASLANPSVSPSPHPSVITLSSRWTRAMKYRQRVTTSPAGVGGIPSKVERNTDIFHQETVHRNRSMHGATEEGVDAAPDVIQHRVGVDNGVSSIDLTAFDHHFPVRGIVSDGYRLVATLSNPVMILTGNHTHVTTPFQLPGGTSASALPKITAIRFHWAIADAAAPNSRLGGGGNEEPLLDINSLNGLREAIDNELAEAEYDEETRSLESGAYQRRATSGVVSEASRIVEEEISEQRKAMESRGEAHLQRPPCEVPFIFCATNSGHIVEHSLSNRYMKWLDHKQKCITATPNDRLFKRWERKMRGLVGGGDQKKKSRSTAPSHSRRTRTAEELITHTRRLLSEDAPVEEWGVAPITTAAAASSPMVSVATSVAAEVGSGGDEWESDGDDQPELEAGENALDLLARPGIPCRCLYEGSVPILDLSIFYGHGPVGIEGEKETERAFTMFALLASSELLVFKANSPVWSVPTSLLVLVKSIRLSVPVSVHQRLDDYSHQGHEDSWGNVFAMERPRGPPGCIPPLAFSHSPLLPEDRRVVLKPVLQLAFGTSCVDDNFIIDEPDIAAELRLRNCLGVDDRGSQNRGVQLGQTPIFSQMCIGVDGGYITLISPSSKVVCAFSLHAMKIYEGTGVQSTSISEPEWIFEPQFPPTAARSHQAPAELISSFIICTDHEVMRLKTAGDIVSCEMLFQTRFARMYQQLQNGFILNRSPSASPGAPKFSAPVGFVSNWQANELRARHANTVVCDSAASKMEGPIATVCSVGCGGDPSRHPSLIAAAQRLEKELKNRFGDVVIHALCRARSSDSINAVSDTATATMLEIEGERRDVIIGFDVDPSGVKCVVSTMSGIAAVSLPPTVSLKGLACELLSQQARDLDDRVEALQLKDRFVSTQERLQVNRSVEHRGLQSEIVKLKKVREEISARCAEVAARAILSCGQSEIRCPRGHLGMKTCQLLPTPKTTSHGEEAYSALFYDTMEDYSTDEGNVDLSEDSKGQDLLAACQISPFRQCTSAYICCSCGADLKRFADASATPVDFRWCQLCSATLCHLCEHSLPGRWSK